MEHLALLVHRMRALQLGYDLEPTNVDLHQIVQRTGPMLEIQAGPEISIRIADPGKEIRVRCVPGLVSRCLANLVSNSRDALGGPGRVELRCGDLPDERLAFVELEDNGPGIRPDLHAKIFERGFSTKNGEHWGLGLYALRRAARRNGGDLKLRSGQPGACCFRLELPLSD